VDMEMIRMGMTLLSSRDLDIVGIDDNDAD
jgi:hypothetical protein